MKQFKNGTKIRNPQIADGAPHQIPTFQNAEIQLWKRIAAKAKVEQQ